MGKSLLIVSIWMGKSLQMKRVKKELILAFLGYAVTYQNEGMKLKMICKQISKGLWLAPVVPDITFREPETTTLTRPIKLEDSLG